MEEKIYEKIKILLLFFVFEFCNEKHSENRKNPGFMQL